jgi:prophage DNA circulation protein
MSIFAKKLEAGLGPTDNVGFPPATGGQSKYGIAEAIQLMRTLPVDQNTELVVRVVRATLASLHVHLPEIIDDASRKQKTIQDRIAAIHGQIAEIEKQLEVHRKEISGLEADLKETTSVKERLQMAEKSAGGASPLAGRTDTAGSATGPFSGSGMVQRPPLSRDDQGSGVT